MTKTARTYAGALFDLAAEESLEDALLADLSLVRNLFRENPDYLRLLTEPSVPMEERLTLLDEAFRAQLHPYSLNFLKILCENGTIRLLPDCEEEFRRRFYEARGILPVRAVCAAPMPEPLQEKLRTVLEQKTGKQILLRVEVDEALLGGIRLELEGRQLDGSVQHHLEAVARALHTAS